MVGVFFAQSAQFPLSDQVFDSLAFLFFLDLFELLKIRIFGMGILELTESIISAARHLWRHLKVLCALPSTCHVLLIQATGIPIRFQDLLVPVVHF